MTPTEDPDGVVLACYYTDWYLIHSDGGRQFIETQDIGCWLEMVDELP